MKSTWTYGLAAALALAAAGAGAAPAACDRDPDARGMPERIEGLRLEMDRIEQTVDRAEQRELMRVHVKKMQEGMRTLRERAAGEGCRVEFMHAMMEQMLRYELAADELRGE